jgi:hypothetical protein
MLDLLFVRTSGGGRPPAMPGSDPEKLFERASGDATRAWPGSVGEALPSTPGEGGGGGGLPPTGEPAGPGGGGGGAVDMTSAHTYT